MSTNASGNGGLFIKPLNLFSDTALYTKLYAERFYDGSFDPGAGTQSVAPFKHDGVFLAQWQ